MGLIAFDLDLNDEVNAAKAIKKEKGRYICPSPECKDKRVPLYLSEKQTGNCFVSYDKSLHDYSCDYPTSYSEKYHNVIPTNFSLESIYNCAIHNVKNEIASSNNNQSSVNYFKKDKHLESTIEIKTLYELYRFCSSNDPSFIVANQSIRDFYISSSTYQYWYDRRSKVSETLVLVVGYTFQVFWYEKRIRLVVDKNNKLKISVCFSESKDFEKIISKIKEYNSNRIKVFISGYVSSKEFAFDKDGKQIKYNELTVTASKNTFHFLSRKPRFIQT